MFVSLWLNQQVLNWCSRNDEVMKHLVDWVLNDTITHEPCVFDGFTQASSRTLELRALTASLGFWWETEHVKMLVLTDRSSKFGLGPPGTPEFCGIPPVLQRVPGAGDRTATRGNDYVARLQLQDQNRSVMQDWTESLWSSRTKEPARPASLLHPSGSALPGEESV